VVLHKRALTDGQVVATPALCAVKSPVAISMPANHITLSTLTDCLWKEILSHQRIRHLKILQSIYFAY